MTSYFQPIAIGVTLGAADALFSIFYEKMNQLAGIIPEECDDEDEEGATKDPIHPSQRWDQCFKEEVIKGPIQEELIFRGLLQPLCKSLLVYCFPRLVTPYIFGLPGAALAASVAMGTLFGALHYTNFKTNGWSPALIIALSGITYGMASERYGLICSIAAHIMSNNCMLLGAKYFPSFLESEKEKQLRLQPR